MTNENEKIIWSQKIAKRQPAVLVKNQHVYKKIINILQRKPELTTTKLAKLLDIHVQQASNYLTQMLNYWIIGKVGKSNYMVNNEKAVILKEKLDDKVIIDKQDYIKLVEYKTKYMEIRKIVQSHIILPSD